MSAGARVASFGALLVAIFALAVVAGDALDPATEAAGRPDHAASAGGGGHEAAPADGGELRLVAQSSTTLEPGRPGRLTFRIVDARDRTLRDFETEQARRMHLIVVRRDLRRFQHLHPVQDASGAWTVSLRLPDAGVYQAFADFQIDGERHTLGLDLFAGGRFEPLALPAPDEGARVDGYDVQLREQNGGRLTFTVRRDGRAVDDLQPYLGARGHLVMLRAGDLAYEHVHPGASVVPGTIVFEGGDVGPGTYRLFLQFRHDDRVHTAALTRERFGP